MTSYKFQINGYGIVQHVQESGAVHTHLTAHEMTRRERIRANRRITYARSFTDQGIMPERRADGYEISLTRLHTLYSKDRNPDKLKTAIQNLQWVRDKNTAFWTEIRNKQNTPLRHNGRIIA